MCVQFGVSTACLYPKETAASLKLLQNNNVSCVEIFLNSFCEIEPDYIKKLVKLTKAGGTHVSSVHPFTSGMETFFFASHYETRYSDGLNIYKKYFEACRALSASRLVFHGDYKDTPYPFKQHCENYLALRREARKYDVELCYENVVRCKCGYPNNIRMLREYTADDVSFVLDIKQMRRAKIEADDMLSAMQGKISLMHLSDYTQANDCVLPGEGNFNFELLFTKAKAAGFCGDIIVELYKDGYNTVEQLPKAADMLKAIYESKERAAK